MKYNLRNLLSFLYYVKNAISFFIIPKYKITAPDFLIIGVQKGGTTWLHNKLNQQENIYFPHFNFGPDSDPTEVRFFSSRRNRSLYWYSSLYKDHAHQLKGDKSPKYYLVEEPMIRLIKKINPNFKIILVLRDPVERAWSQAVMNLKRFHGISYEDNPKAYKKFLKHNLAHGLYSRYIRKWGKYFDKKHFLILSYEQIKSEPEDLLKNLLQFLEYKGEINFQHIDKLINKNPKEEMPEDIEQWLRNYYADDQKDLKNLLSNFLLDEINYNS
jgi:hypothetical protein